MAADSEKTIRLLVEGIVCTGCAMDMETVMNDMEGVLETSVNYQEGVITVVFDPEEIDESTVISKVVSFKFKTTLLPENNEE